MQDESPLSCPRWAVTTFSLTHELLSARMSALDIMREAGRMGVARILEVDAPQAFATYPRISDEEVERFREMVDAEGIELSMLGVYNDLAARPGCLFGLDESEAFIAHQIEAAAKLGFPTVRIMFGQPYDLLERLAVHAERLGIDVLQEVQGSVRPDSVAFVEQLANIDSIGSARLAFVFDLSACMPGLPVTYLDALKRHDGVSEGFVDDLEDAWMNEPLDAVQSRIHRYLADHPVSPDAQSLLHMPFHRFGKSLVAEWEDHVDVFRAIHLKYWDLEDDGYRVSTPIADMRRTFGARGYQGVITSEWGGHEWFPEEEADGYRMTAGHRDLYDRSLARVRRGAQ